MKNPFSKTLERLRAGAADIAKELERVRLDRLATLSEADRVRRLSISDEEIAARVDAYLLEEEKDARRFYQPDGFTTPMDAGLVTSVKTNIAFEKHPAGLLCALGIRDTVRSAMLADAKRYISGEQISADARSTKLAALASELHALDLAEESLVRACEENGLAVHRRADADPAIFLLDEL